MDKYICDGCNKKFNCKSHYNIHNGRKIPCNKNKTEKVKLNVLDLFCGCGGMSKGLEQSGLNIVAGIDIWDKAIESYKRAQEIYPAMQSPKIMIEQIEQLIKQQLI